MNADEIINKLRKELPEEENRINKVNELLNSINTNFEDKKVLTENLEALQQLENELFSTYGDGGAGDELIELQIIINEFRHKYDITDPREVINWDNGKGFVQ